MMSSVVTSTEVCPITEAGKTNVQSTNNITSPFRLWILVSAVGFTVMALMVSGVKQFALLFVLNFISLCLLL